MARFLREMYGQENVLMSDIIKPTKSAAADGKLDRRSLLCLHYEQRVKQCYFYFHPCNSYIIFTISCHRTIHLRRYP